MTRNTSNDPTEGSRTRSDSEFDRDQPSENAGAPLHRGSTIDDRGRKDSTPDRDSDAIPPLDEPDVEGVGNEGGD